MEPAFSRMLLSPKNHNEPSVARLLQQLSKKVTLLQYCLGRVVHCWMVCLLQSGAECLPFNLNVNSLYATEDLLKANCVDQRSNGSGCRQIVENLGNAMKVGFRCIGSDASRQGINQANTDRLQCCTLLCRIASFALALVLLCHDKIEEAVHKYFGEVLPTESTPWGVIAMKKAARVNDLLGHSQEHATDLTESPIHGDGGGCTPLPLLLRRRRRAKEGKTTSTAGGDGTLER
jgi:hypothetical protein